MKVKLFSIFFFTLFTSLYAQNEFWQKIPTIIDAGNSVSMAVDSLGYIYNGTSDRGLFQSTDNGLSWHNLDLGFSDPKIRKVRVTPDGSIIAATTKYGILNSSDNGKTWSQINGTLNPTDILTISSGPGYILTGTSNGLFKSSDRGKNWTADTSFTGHKIVEVENISGTIFCYSLYSGNQVLSVSSDAGKNWSKTNSPSSTKGFAFAAAPFAYDKASGRVICAAYSPSYNGAGTITYTSRDNGKTWANNANDVAAAYARIINSFLEESSGVLFATCSGDGIIKSTDWGLSWQDASSGISNSFVGSITSDKKGNFYAGTTCGIMFSSDHGSSWKEVSKGLNTSTANSFVSDKAGNLYLSSPSTVFKSKDGGLSWTPIMKELKTGYLENLREVDNNVFITYVNSIVGRYVISNSQKYYSDSNSWGKDIHVVNQTGVDPQGRIYYIYSSYGLNGNIPNHIAVSSDGGDNWSTLIPDGSYGWNPPFAVDPSKGIIYFSVAKNIKKSSDYGVSWNNTNYSGDCIKLRSNARGYLFAMPDSSSIMRSIDEGNTWQNIHNNLPASVRIAEIYFDRNDRVFLLTSDSQIFYSKTNGDSCLDISNNIPRSKGGIVALAFGDSSRIFACSVKGEVFRTATNWDPETSTDSAANSSITAPKGYSLEQNYPNPFNPKTRIFYTMPHAGNVNISLFDAMGRKVQELVNEYKSEGIFSVDFDGKSFTSGVYFYRIQSGSYTETKKLMLLK